MNHELLNNTYAYALKQFDIQTLVIDSDELKKNPLKDSHQRFNLVLKPKNYNDKKSYNLMIVLSGFTSNGTKYFGHKPFEKNYPQTLDEWCFEKKVDDCIVVFIDAFTFWGGSQFINSPLVGNYENYIIKEVLPKIHELFNISKHAKDICVTGGSSGGYGALHLGSNHPHIFGKVAAIAPDCDFALSLLPEIYHALPLIEKWGGLKKIKEELKSGAFFRRRESHTVINVIAMAHCYSSAKSGQPKFPFSLKMGELITKEWKHWLKHDPIHFVKKRKKNIEQLSGIYLEVGKYDQFNLQYGARKLKNILKNYKVKLNYKEFNGNHFDISKQRPNFWSWFTNK